MSEHRPVDPVAVSRVDPSDDGMPGLSVEWLGTRPYADALAFQETAVRDRLAGRSPDRLLLLEHPQVVTLGRSADPDNLKLGEDELRAAGVDLFEVGRGGDVTYHAPGQLVGYPIIDLDALGRRDVHAHLRSLESALIDSLEEIGVPSMRIPGWTGVFVDRERSSRPDGRERKIASIGVGVRRWVTFHGFALNVTIDLAGFEAIVPCGLRDVEMTSIEIELARRADVGVLGRDELDARVRKIVGESMRFHLSVTPGR
jgi:lipoate-protein ligase B